MKRQLAAASRPPKQSAAGGSRKAKGKQGKGSKAAAAAAAGDTAAEERAVPEAKSTAEGALTGSAVTDMDAAATGCVDAAAATDAEEGVDDSAVACASDATDTQPGSDTDAARKQHKPAVAGQEQSGDVGKGKKRRTTAPASQGTGISEVSVLVHCLIEQNNAALQTCFECILRCIELGTVAQWQLQFASMQVGCDAGMQYA